MHIIQIIENSRPLRTYKTKIAIAVKFIIINLNFTRLSEVTSPSALTKDYQPFITFEPVLTLELLFQKVLKEAGGSFTFSIEFSEQGKSSWYLIICGAEC